MFMSTQSLFDNVDKKSEAPSNQSLEECSSGRLFKCVFSYEFGSEMTDKKFSFRGLMAPVFTPFHENRSLNLHAVPEYAEYLHKNGIDGVLVNGTTGEGVSLTVDERKDVLAAWMETSKLYNQTVMVQVGGTNLEDVKTLARHAEQLNVDAILCLADLFFKPANVDDLVRYLNIVSAEAPSTPLLYYHIPSFTGINLNMKELLERASEIPTFVGIKFTDNDLVMGNSFRTKNLENRSVFLGCDSLLLPALFYGFDSAIGTTINMFPVLNREILDCFYAKDYDKAAAIQKKLNHNIQEIAKHGSWVSSMKAAMRQITSIEVGPVRDPLVDVNFEDFCWNLML